MIVYRNTSNEIIPKEEYNNYNHCFYCDEMNYNILYKDSEMYNSTQSNLPEYIKDQISDNCCEHCSISLFNDINNK